MSSSCRREQLDPHLAAQRGVEVRQRLVEQEDLRLAHDRPADGDTLALTAGQILGPPLQIGFQLQNAGGLVDLAVAFGLGTRARRKANAMFCRTVMCGYSA